MAKDTEDTIFAEAGEDALEKRTVFTGPPTAVGEEALEGTIVAGDTESSTEAGLTTDRVLRPPPPAEPLADRTSFAQEGMKLAINFAHQFAKHAIGARSHLRLRLHDPGVSTAGGMNARQSIVLVANAKDRGTTVIGWLDTSRHRAALKTWDVLATQHAQRHKSSFDVAREEYEKLAQEIRDFLHESEILLEAHEAGEAPPPTEGPSGVKEWSLTYRHILGLIALILIAGMILGSVLAKSCASDPSEDEEQIQEDVPRFRRVLRKVRNR